MGTCAHKVRTFVILLIIMFFIKISVVYIIFLSMIYSVIAFLHRPQGFVIGESGWKNEAPCRGGVSRRSRQHSYSGHCMGRTTPTSPCSACINSDVDVLTGFLSTASQVAPGLVGLHLLLFLFQFVPSCILALLTDILTSINICKVFLFLFVLFDTGLDCTPLLTALLSSWNLDVLNLRGSYKLKALPVDLLYSS